MRPGNPNILISPRNWRRAAMLAGILLTSACSRTFGGGVVSAHCIRGQTELEMKNGDQVYVGVGDIEFDGTDKTIHDAMILTAENGHLKVDAPGGGNEHMIVNPGSEPSQLRFQAEEDRSNVHVYVQPGTDGLLRVHIDKTCPDQ